MSKVVMKKRLMRGILAGLLAVQTLGLTGCSLGSEKEVYVEPVPEEIPEEQVQEEAEDLSSGSYEMVYLSQWSLETVREEDLDLNFQCEYYLSDHEIADLEEMEEYLSAVASGLPSLKVLILGFRPDLLDIGELLASEAYLKVLDAHPEARILLVPAYPSMEYWTGLSEERCGEVLDAYEAALNTISAAEKEGYFYGSSQWLVENPALYEKEFCVTEELSYTMIGLMEEVYRYQIKPWNGQSLADELRALVGRYRNGEVTYPDLSGRKIVVFGDSIFGNYRGETGIAKILSRQTGAEVYNLAIGGVSCADAGEGAYSFGKEISLFRGEDLADVSIPEDAAEDYAAAREQVTAADGSAVLFVVEFGPNDYFGGHPVGTVDSTDVTTTLGALRLGIQELQEEFPKAEILVLAPGLTAYFEYGTEPQSDVGADLATYRAGMQEVAASMGVRCIDLSTESGVNEETFTYYVSDLIHFNERGRFLVAGKLGEWIAEK